MSRPTAKYHRPALEPLEDRILLSHRPGHAPGGGSGGGDAGAAQYDLIQLGTLGGAVSEALDVNADGLVVGYASDGSRQLAFVVQPEDTDGDGAADRWFRDDDSDGVNDLMIPLTTVADLRQSQALGINASGQVVGLYDTASARSRAFLITPQMIDGSLRWNADANGDGVNDLMTDLGDLGGGRSIAFDVNDHGQVVGTAGAPDNNDYPFLWNPDAPNGSTGTMIHLGTLGRASHFPGSGIGAYQINNNSQIVGISKVVDPASTSGGWLRGFLITPQDTDGDGTPDLWSSLDGNGINMLMTDLEVLDANSSEAYSLNDAGVIVGETGSTISEVWGHAVRWDQQADGNYAVTGLGSLHKGQFYSTAQDINANGVIVGFSQEMTLSTIRAGGGKLYERIGEERAFVIKNGKMQPLDQLVSGLAGLDTVNAALAVSDNGHIAGWGEIDGNRRAFVAVPVSANLIAASTRPGAVADSLTISQVRPLFEEAVSRWQAAGVDTSVLTDMQVQITDLPGNTLGLVSGSNILLDIDAAGWGWFVDPSPWEDSEFFTPGDQGEMNRMDLLSVLMHEVGHLLGEDHDEAGVMADTLSAGTRLTTISADEAERLAFAADELFAWLAAEAETAWTADSLSPWARTKR